MKNKIYTKKKSAFKKLFINLCRFYNLEIIDQSNFEIPTRNISANENLSINGKKSITIPLGVTSINKKYKSLTIIIRSYSFGDVEGNKVMLDQNKKRIFEHPKIEYTLRTINSIITSCEEALNHFKDFKFKIIVTDDRSADENLEKINNLLNKTKITTQLINLKENEFTDEIKDLDTNGNKISKNMISNMRNILKSIEISEKDNAELFYFLEDDYIHVKNSITEMLYTYEKLASQLDRELFLCPADYPYLYSNIEPTNVFFGNQRHWRSVKETLITFLTSKKMIIKYLKDLKLMGTLRHHPMELKLHEIYEKEYCLSPIPSLSMHATNINSIYGIPPNFNWKKVWDENEIND